MYLLLSIFSSIMLGVLLFFLPLQAVAIIVFGIVTGCLFRAVYLLNDLHERISSQFPKKRYIQKAYESHLKKRDSDKNSYLN